MQDHDAHQTSLLHNVRKTADQAVADIEGKLASVSLSNIKRIELESQKAALTSPGPSQEALRRLADMGVQPKAKKPTEPASSPAVKRVLRPRKPKQ